MKASKRNLAAAVLAGAMALGLSAPAAADWDKWEDADRWEERSGHRGKPQARGEFDYAKVIAARPRWSERHETRRQCSEELVGYSQPSYRSDGRSYGGAIIGAVAGGVIGAQVGKGNGNKVATAVGAATGAIVGDRIGNSHSGYRTAGGEPIYETRCHSWSEPIRERDGYEVTYVYAGQKMRAFARNDPGQWLRVRVSVSPAE